MTPQVRPFAEAIEDASRGNPKLRQSEFAEYGPFPVVDQGQRLIAGYTNDETLLCRVDGPVILFGDHTRTFKYIDFQFVIGADGVKVLRVRDGWNSRYVYHYLRSQTVPSAGYSRHFKFLKEIEIPQPPIEEQRRIAATLDHAGALRAKRRQILAHLDALTQSIFHDMFGDPDSATDTVSFGQVAGLSGGRNIVADDSNADTEFRVLKISAVTTGAFKAWESKPLPAKYQPPPSHLVRQGDLLMSRANTTELVGAVAYVHDTPSNLALPDKIWRFDWREPESVPLFYHALFQTAAIRRRISRLSSGTGGSMKNVSKAKLVAMPLPNVSFEQQREFAEVVETVARGRTGVRRALDADDELFASLQSRAFRGEL